MVGFAARKVMAKVVIYNPISGLIGFWISFNESRTRVMVMRLILRIL